MSYIDRSKEIVASIDVEHLASIVPKHTDTPVNIGLGKIETCEGPIHTRLIIDFGDASVDASVPACEMLEVAEAIADRSPDALPALPSFIALIALKGTDHMPIGIVTEDFTRGGTVTSKPVFGVSTDLQEKLSNGFADMTFRKSPAGVLNPVAMRLGPVNDYGGQEKIALPDRDIFNPYFYEKNKRYFTDKLQEARLACEGLTLSIAPSSPLREALLLKLNLAVASYLRDD